MNSSTTAFIKKLLAENAPKLIDELIGSREYTSPLKSAVDASDSLAPTVVSGGLGDGITRAAESAFKGLSNSTYRTPILNATASSTGDDASRRQLFGASVGLQKSAVDSEVSTGGTFERNQSPAEATPSGAAQPQAVALAAHAANRLIVKFKDGVASAQINQYKDLFGAVTTKTIPLTGAQIWTLSGELSVEQILAQYKSNSAFAYVEPDYIVTAGSVSSKAIPNDPGFNQLWGLNNTGQSGGTVDADIDAPEAWDIQTGNPNLVIGVIDTGVDYNHPDLKDNIWVNTGEIAGDGIDNDANGYVDDVRGWDFAYGDNNPMDVYGHGTHVSGTIAGKGNNAIGVTGVAWNAKIMPLKFLDDSGSGLISNAILAVNYATTKGVKITNNSWGGGGYSTALYDAINAAGSAGALFIAAAGNDSKDADTFPMYPAAYNLANIVSVAATNRNDGLAYFSNYGLTSVDLGAPGEAIYSTTPGNNYATYSGTSMATPHVAGAAALLWSKNPSLTAAQVKNTLMNTGDSIAALAGKTVSGKRLNIYKALSGGTLPTVSVAVSPASVLEDGLTNFTYTLTRTTENLSSPLTVNFGIAGTANAAPVGPDPADYSVLTSPTVTFDPTTKKGTVIFAAGSTSATVTVDPTADVLQEFDETVLVTVLDGSGYLPGASNAAQGKINSEEAFTNYFLDDFSTNTKGWTLGTEWQIGTATASTGHVYGNPDPGIDNTPTSDNGVAGVVIGGNASQTAHDFYYLTSPAFNTSAATSLYFEYARWLNSDYTPYMQNTVDVYNGTSWVNLFSTGASPGIQDNAWTPQSFNISSYKSASTQVRFGFKAASGAYKVSSWNVDDVKIYGDGGVTLPVVTISANDSAAGETPIGVIANPGQFTLSRTGSTAAALTINLAVSGTASNGTDYTAIGSTVTFAAGSSTALVDLNVIDDLLVEESETAILTVAAGAGYSVGAASSATVNIADDDTPVITIIATDSDAAEVTGGANPGQFTLYRSGSVAAALTVNVATSGTATNGTDYAAVPGTVTFAAGSSTAIVNINVTDDAAVEGTETVTLTVTPGSGYVPGGLKAQSTDSSASAAIKPLSTSTISIIDNDYSPTSIIIDAYDQGWYDSTGFHGPANPNYFVGDPISTNGLLFRNWFAFNIPTLYSAITSASLKLKSYDVSAPSESETFALYNVETAVDTVVAGGSGKTAIYTDLGDGAVYGSRSYTNADTNTTQSIELNATALSAISAKSGSKFALGGQITTLDTVDNSESVFGYSAGNPGDVQLVLNLVASVVTVSASDSGAAETTGVANPGKFTLARSGSTTAALTVNIGMTGSATNGTDYTLIPATVTFAAGAATADVNLTVTDDAIVEGSETAVLTVAAGAGYTVGAASSATVSIADDDLPVITIVATDSDAAEVTGGANPGQFTLYRSGPVAAALTVNVATSGTATNGTDYAAVPGTVTFAAGSSTAIININVTDDAAVEGTETVTLTVTTGSGYVPGGLKAQNTDGSASAAIKPLSTSTISIIDNDSSPTSIIIDAYDQGWYNNSGFHGPTNPNYIAGDNETPGALYRNWFAFNIPTLSSAIASASLKLKSYLVSTPSASETFALYDVATAVDEVVAGGSGKTAIYADLGDGALYGSRSYTNADTNTTQSIKLNATALSAISAKSGSKFALGGQITTLDTVDNIEFIFGNSGSSGDVQLVLNLVASVVTVSASDSGAAETTGVANPGKFTLARSGSTTAALTVNIGMTGSATNGTDYTLIPTTVTFAAGAATADVNLTVTDDAIVEGSETAVLTVAAGAGYTVGAGASATVTIADNDLPVVTVIATDPTAAETAGAPDPGVFTLSRSGPTTNSLTVAVAMSGTSTNGADYTTIPATATFAAGSATAVVNVAVIDDLLIEGATPETAILTIQSGLTYVVGAASSATVTITDNDLPVITVSATDALAEETSGAPNPGSFTLTRTGPTTDALTVAVAMSGSATNGVDYTTVPTTATFAAGSPTALVNINVIDDSIIEGPTPETAVLTVNPGSGYTVGAPANATVSIADNDFIPVSLSSNYSGVSENSKENLVYKVSRTVGLADTLTINLTLGGTAVRPSDYNAYGLTILTPTTATLSLAAGAASAEFELVTKGDLVKENNETIDITLAAGIGYLIGTPGSVQTTIINDDGVLNQIGTSGKDFIEAGSTKNLSGGAGDDVLIGSAAGNVLSGGTGNDLVTTGAGFDVITFGSASEGIDTVTDFNVLYDTLQVSAAGFGGGLTPGQSIDASQFTLGSSATNANHRFIYNALDGKLYFDSDGNGAISSVLFAQLATGLALNEDNIFAA